MNVSVNLNWYFAETTPELEPSATPLMLTGIPSTDFTLARDFLVMQDEQINVINSFKNQNIGIEDNQIDLTSVTNGANKENNNLTVLECDREQFPKATSPAEKKKTLERKDVRRSKRHITDKKDFCECQLFCIRNTTIYYTYVSCVHIIFFLYTYMYIEDTTYIFMCS